MSTLSEQDWLSLATDELHLAFRAIVQPRKHFFLGAAILRRVWPLLPTEAALAVEITEQFASGRASEEELIESWVEAEYASDQGVWVSWELCESLSRYDEFSEEDPLAQAARHAIQAPSWFAARAAEWAHRLVSEEARPGDAEDAELRERRAQFRLYQDIVGDPREPFRRCPVPVPRHSPLAQLLGVVSRQQRIDALALFAVADALEEAGCVDGELLRHCREPGPHVRGCWAVERLLGRTPLSMIA